MKINKSWGEKLTPCLLPQEGVGGSSGMVGWEAEGDLGHNCGGSQELRAKGTDLGVGGITESSDDRERQGTTPPPAPLTACGPSSRETGTGLPDVPKPHPNCPVGDISHPCHHSRTLGISPFIK